MSENPRETFLNAARDSLQAMWPDRHVMRGLVTDPLNLEANLRRKGVFCLIGGRLSDWATYVGREAEFGRLEFAIVFWGELDGEGTRTLDGSDTLTLRVEQMEAQAEWELLQWCQAVKSGPLLDAVYPLESTPSGGLDAPVGWVVFRLEGGYV
jgi:hypothetical protein